MKGFNASSSTCREEGQWPCTISTVDDTDVRPNRIYTASQGWDTHGRRERRGGERDYQADIDLGLLMEVYTELCARTRAFFFDEPSKVKDGRRADETKDSPALVCHFDDITKGNVQLTYLEGGKGL